MDNKELTVSIHAEIKWMNPPADTAEAARRSSANAKIASLGRKLEAATRLIILEMATQ